MSIPSLQAALKRYRGIADDLPIDGIVYRRTIADRASAIDGSGPFEEADVEQMECRIRRPPDGLKLRTHCAAVGLPLLDALGHLDYWPPLRLGPALISLALVRDFCRRSGLFVAAEDLVNGRVVIQL